MARHAHVYLHGEFAGELAEESTGLTSFRLARGYRETVPRPVLSQSFEDDLERAYRGKRAGELPAFFANLVPEGALRELVEQSAGLEPGDDFGLLLAVGRDLPGAVELRETDEEPGATAHGSELIPDRGDDVSALVATRFSLAGLQLKFSVLRQAEKITLPARGQRGQWIAKLDSPRFPQVVENEFAMLEWARAAGFDVPECHLLPVSSLVGIPRRVIPENSRLLLIKRYDRRGDERIHQEDFAQVARLPPRLKYHHITYEQLGLLIRQIAGREAYDEFVRRLIFVVASGNGDAHLKNWSLINPNRIHAQLAPVYDQVATVAWHQVDKELSLKLAGVKEFGRIDVAALERFARKSQDDPQRVVDLARSTVARIADAWEASSARPPLLHLAALRDHWRQVPLLRDSSQTI
jgi:serine/threonine-protein kinase HipA